MGTRTTRIEWTQRTWNPVVGCSHISPACDNCYAEDFAIRLHYQAMADLTKFPEYTSVVDDDGWTGKVELCHHRLNDPDKWPPSMIFVPSMSDVFHKLVPFEYIDQIMATIVRNPQHTFQLLTKRANRMLEYWRTWSDFGFRRIMKLVEKTSVTNPWAEMKLVGKTSVTNPWVDPIPNLWTGCTIENNKTARDRLYYFMQIPSVFSFLSLEPLLERVKLQLRPDGENCLICGDTGHQMFECHHTKKRMPDQIIMGGESGRKARPTHPDWFRYVRDETLNARVPTSLFFKGWGRWSPGPETKISHRFDDGTIVYKQRSKKAAGRLLDGKMWEQYPV